MISNHPLYPYFFLTFSEFNMRLLFCISPFEQMLFAYKSFFSTRFWLDFHVAAYTQTNNKQINKNKNKVSLRSCRTHMKKVTREIRSILTKVRHFPPVTKIFYTKKITVMCGNCLTLVGIERIPSIDWCFPLVTFLCVYVF